MGGSKAASNASSNRCTGKIWSAARTDGETSAIISGRFRAGTMARLRPARLAASSFSFSPPTCMHTRPTGTQAPLIKTYCGHCTRPLSLGRTRLNLQQVSVGEAPQSAIRLAQMRPPTSDKNSACVSGDSSAAEEAHWVGSLKSVNSAHTRTLEKLRATLLMNWAFSNPSHRERYPSCVCETMCVRWQSRPPSHV